MDIYIYYASTEKRKLISDTSNLQTFKTLPPPPTPLVSSYMRDMTKFNVFKFYNS